MKRILFFVSALFVAFACTNSLEEKSTTGDITGIVYDNSIGEPVPVAKVQLRENGKTAVTGTDGSYNFTREFCRANCRSVFDSLAGAICRLAPNQRTVQNALRQASFTRKDKLTLFSKIIQPGC